VRHNFLVVTVKKGLKSVYIYQRYYKNKLGGPFFGTPCIHAIAYMLSRVKTIGLHMRVYTCSTAERKNSLLLQKVPIV